MMKTKTKTKTKKKVQTKKANTPETVLAYLSRTYNFEPRVADRIKAALNTQTAPVRPFWMEDEPDYDEDYECYALGYIDDHQTYIYPPNSYHNGGRTAILHRGCVNARSRSEAEYRWDPDGRSRVSTKLRPHIPELIEYVAAFCKWKGWKW